MEKYANYFALIIVLVPIGFLLLYKKRISSKFSFLIVSILMNLGVTILVGSFAFALPLVETQLALKVADWVNLSIIVVIWLSLSVFLTKILLKKFL